VHIGESAAAAGHPGERRHERGVPRHDLQDQVGKIDAGQHALQAAAQINEARRVGDRVDLVGVQPPVRVDVDLRAGDEPVGERSPGPVELLSVLSEQLARVLGQPERVERRRPSGVPCRPGEQLRARVAPARRRAGVDVAPQQMAVKLLQDAEHVGRPVDRAVRATGLEHQAPPPARRNDVVGDAAASR
jgi:hypothetical protein